tara:strand:- start:1111 stop:1944 length:834 start_codon:yes stop_codon:yes gene_type:complete
MDTSHRHIKKQRLFRKLPNWKSLAGISDDEINAHFKLMPESYFPVSQISEIELHLKMINQLKQKIDSTVESQVKNPFVIKWSENPLSDTITITAVLFNMPGLFHKLVGALTLSGIDIVNSKAVTRMDDIAIDTFTISNSSKPADQNAELVDTFIEYFERIINQGEDLDYLISMQNYMIDSPVTLCESMEVDRKLTTSVDSKKGKIILLVQALDTVGLLYQISKVIFENNYTISSAHILTKRNQVTDVFNIEKFGEDTCQGCLDLIDLETQLGQIVIA